MAEEKGVRRRERKRGEKLEERRGKVEVVVESEWGSKGSW